MRAVSKKSLTLCSIAILFLAGCSYASSNMEQKEGVKASISEESLGLRKVDIYHEDKALPEKTEYRTSYPGSGEVIKRAFQDAPPMIPHDVNGMLPITIKDNQCISCHSPEVAKTMSATPIPTSHFTDFRPKHKFDGEMFHKSVDNYKNEVSIKKSPTVSGARFNCTQCHAPQSKGEIVSNTFKAEFTSKDGEKKSSWRGSKFTEALDTLGDESFVTDEDLANKNSKAGSLEEH